ncbi:MAG TPA: FAD-dependent oxidoreductase [Acidimicrobiales bacterium]|nr:FAD-dependent oxidoreductase [Acidimicrobiales bacterium]
MTTTTAPQFSLEGFSGTVFRPDDAGYDEAREVFNGMIDRRPALIARCAGVDDVVAVVNLARDNDLPLSIYGGGHGVTGSAVVDAGICLDLRGMRAVDVDPDARRARVEGGATWGEVDAATQEHGLAVTGAGCRVPGWQAWPWEAGAVGSSVPSASSATTWWRPRWSPPTAGW